MKIIITGATGCIGTAIIQNALIQGHEITCIVHRGSKRLSNIPSRENINIIECNLSEYSNLEISEKYDWFIHLAWDKTVGSQRDDVDIQLKNVQYTLDACRLAKRLGCSVFVGAGSQAEYGPCNELLNQSIKVNPESGYGIAKFTAGKLAAMLCNQLDIRFNWIRVLSIYGPNDGSKSLISYLIDELKQGHNPNVTKCEQIWDYLYSNDAGKAFLAVAEKGINGKCYVLGSGKGKPLKDYIEEIKNAINPSLTIQYGVIDYYPHQPMHLVADITDLTNDTGWKSETEFTKGVKNLLQNGKFN